MKLFWSKQAQRDIEEIVSYYKPVAGIRTTQKMVQKIHAGVLHLAANPRAGRREDLLEDSPQEYRRVIVGSYKIIYCIKEETVYISTVFDTRRNPEVLRQNLLGADA
ncbi:MAG: type II toxin-antitoxin system RelE/ParE family toxin [Prevotellaceae bacterium]|jgi:plasmid stabilization system protein ParE|nr:type II toxin-antitoxin system RelE/ParE family toxin [Prevotellaceae bacterium]